MKEQYEVIVVGGGMVGATAACLLGVNGIKVALIDGFKPPREWPEDSVDTRVSALTKASQHIFQALNVWPDILRRGVCAYQHMRVWDAQGSGELHFDSADTDFDELGHIVENRVTVAALWDLLETLPSVTLLCPVKVSDLQIHKGRRSVLLDDGTRIDGQLLIAADGRDSALRSMAGIAVTGWDYQQQGLVATVSTSTSHQHTAWQRFLTEGPLAFLPLKNGQCSIVWSLSPETAQQYLALSEAEFLEHLQKASAGILGDMLSASNRAAFALRFQYANTYISDAFALLGDAAHAMHPLAGQGANAGLLDAAAIAELIVQARQQGRPIASRRILRKYERWRKGDNLLMMSSMDVLKRAYAQSTPAFVSLRSGGMSSINNNAIIKNMINAYAMGLRDDLPKTAQKSAF